MTRERCDGAVDTRERSPILGADDPRWNVTYDERERWLA